MDPMNLSPSRRGWLAALVYAAVLVAGLLIGLSPAAPPKALAAVCQTAHQGCAGSDTTLTSVMEVNHATTASPADPVLPHTGESWAIAVNWATTPGGICNQVTSVAYATVDWNGGGWTVSNVTLAAGIVGIAVCDAGSCSGGPYGASPSRRYRLKVDITDPIPGGYNLRDVVYTTTSVDNGQIVTNSSCGTGSSVTPTSQTFTATDSGTFECSYDCTAITGPLVTLTY